LAVARNGTSSVILCKTRPLAYLRRIFCDRAGLG
jgi:hypothetical protein